LNPDELRINSFLRFGYFCDYDKQLAPIDFSRIDKDSHEDVSWEDLVKLGVEKLNETFTELWQEGRQHVVPLSGGLDSRLILGALLEHTSANELCTYTYGLTGSYDFEISNSIAKRIGTQHLPIRLDEFAYSIQNEYLSAKRTDCQGVLFHHPPFEILDDHFPSGLFWSGYVGDAIAGSYLRSKPSTTLREAQLRHLQSRVFVRSIKLHRCTDEDFLACMYEDHIDPEVLTLDEQVLFSEAATKFTAPLVLFSGYEFVTPLINTPWMDFILSVPNQYRYRQRLMIEVCRTAYPHLFSLPSANRLGHTFDASNRTVRSTFWINRVRKALHQFFPSVNWPNFQYYDFNEAARSNSSYRQILEKSINDLRDRGICDWVDFDGIWRRHDWRIGNHGDALVTLASLEIVLRAGEVGRQA